MEKSYAEYLLNKTTEDYNLIAEHFSSTRSFIWEELKPLSEYTTSGDKILDLGCGNGRLLEIFKDKKIDYWGVDSSENLINIAKNRYPKARFQVANALKLPFPSNFFDKVYSIAVLHHIPSEEFRAKFMEEIKRVLKPKGLLILTVWYLLNQKKILKLLCKYTFLKLTGRSKLDFKDIFYHWKDLEKKIVISRYFHCFTKKELEKITQDTGFKVKKSWKEGRSPRTNLYLVVKK